MIVFSSAKKFHIQFKVKFGKKSWIRYKVKIINVTFLYENKNIYYKLYIPASIYIKKKNQQKMLMHKIKIELGYQQIKKKHIPNDYKISFIQRKQFICA